MVTEPVGEMSRSSIHPPGRHNEMAQSIAFAIVHVLDNMKDDRIPQSMIVLIDFGLEFNYSLDPMISVNAKVGLYNGKRIKP